MLTPHRRHTKDCPHAAKGWNYTLCDCPVWCDGMLKGGRVTRSLHTRDWERAMRRLMALERGDDTVISTQSGVTLQTAVAAFTSAAKGRALAKETLRGYADTFGHFTKELGKGVPLSAIGPAELERYRTARKVAAGTWAKELKTLRTFFAWCVESGRCTDNPAKRVRMPKTGEFLTPPFSTEETQRILLACDRLTTDNPREVAYVRHRARALVLTLLYSGLRIGDVAMLRRDSLDGQHMTLRVLKTGVRLQVLLHADAIRALETLPANHPDYFFWSGRGALRSVTNSMRVTIARLGKLAEVKRCTPHRFRDTFAVELLTGGADIRTVQQLLGHKSVRTTERHYAHFVAAHQKLLDAAASRLDFTPKSRPLLMHLGGDRLRDAK